MKRKVLTLDGLRAALAALPATLPPCTEVWCASESIVDGDEDSLYASAEGVRVVEREIADAQVAKFGFTQSRCCAQCEQHPVTRIVPRGGEQAS